MYKRRQVKRSKKAFISRAGNFHMALPQALKIRLTALDSSLMTLGLGQQASKGSPTRSLTQYELFYPRGLYHREPFNYGIRTNAWPFGTTQWPYAGFSNPPGYSEETVVSVFPGQMNSFLGLYKLARVERVDFHFKYTNLGPSSITGSGNPPSGSNQSLSSGSINHTILKVPQQQYQDTFVVSGGWTPSSLHSDSNACQMAELPGATLATSSQDGNREVIHIRKSYDCAQLQAGDTIRSSTWMTSSDTAWTFPSQVPTDPVLLSIGTSPLIDQILINTTSLTDTDNNVWLRYNEHVHVTYHITFWDPKTPTILFT